MIRLATIGTNFITDWLMEGILELDEIQLTAVYSRNLEKGKQFAAKYNVEKVYDNYEEMAKDPEIDAVYVASPTYMHYTHSITMINYGKHVLCEKPVCSNREELDILIKAAKEQGVVFMEAMKNVHSPGFHAMMDNLHKIDAVYVASPTYMHYTHSITMINYGKHVLCEKPVCSNREELDILIKAAKEQGVVFMEAMKNVHSPGFHAMMDNLHKIGTVRRATIQYCQYSSRYDKFKKGIIENAFNPKLSNGALMDIGSYCIHFLASLFGKPEKILADSLFLENGVDGAGSVITSYGDKQAEIIYSKITDSKLPTQIQGENGCMIIEQCPIIKKITIYYRNGETEELQFDKRDNPMIYETKDFIRLIKEHKVDHQFLRSSEIEMDITDEVRRQTGIVFPADKIREQ